MTQGQLMSDKNIVAKSKQMGFFRLVYWGFTYKKSEEVITKNGTPIEELAEKIQLEYFTKHPQKKLCDPRLYRPLMKSNTCDSAVMRILKVTPW